MGLISEIARGASVRVHSSGASELIAAADLRRFLAEARARNVSVLGLEGFRFTNGELVPDMEAIADFSALGANADCGTSIDEALQFLSTMGETDLFFDVTAVLRPL